MGTATGTRPLRIGELAELTGTTPRTIRYWEEIGLLGGTAERQQGKHRTYSEQDVARVKEILRLKSLLGLSLEQLSRLLEAESARAELRREYEQVDDPHEQRRFLTELHGHLSEQLELVRGRKAEIVRLEEDLEDRRRRAEARIAALSDADPAGTPDAAA